MNFLAKLFGWKSSKDLTPMLALIDKIIDEETAHLDAALVAARLRVAKYDGIPRLTHTQEILRAQAVAQVECYNKVVSPTFRADLAQKIVAEILG